jgi:hypothetical protein
MTGSTKRKILRWSHIILSIPIIGLIYGPVAEVPRAMFAIRFVFFPIIVISGLWMWKGHIVEKYFRKRLPTIEQKSK